MSKNSQRKAARYGHQPIEPGWKPQRGFEALKETLVSQGSAEIVGYESLRLPTERRTEFRTSGVWFR